MIEEEWRYFAPGGAITPGGPSTWYILDWDQRRLIAVTMDEAQESEDTAIRHLRRHIDSLGPDVLEIHLSQDGELVSLSTNPEDDHTFYAYHPPLRAIQPLDRVKSVLRSDLLELDRVAQNVDLVSYAPDTNAAEMRQVIFKYYFLIQYVHRWWDEMNLWMRLPQHPNIVPFDRLVLDELRGDVVGFTNLYIPGGTIFHNKSRVFRLEWFRQLTGVIDDLNFKYGIAHQDIAPRNLLVNPKTDTLMLFDFDYSSRIGSTGYWTERNDVKGAIFTLNEIITRDMQFRDVNFDQQNPADVQGLDEWVQHPDVKLDHPVSEYRSVLNEWVRTRREGRQIAMYTEAPEYIDWPDFPKPPPKELFSDANGNLTIGVPMSISRRDGRKKGIPVLNWERPAHSKLGSGDRVLASGEMVR